MISNGVLSTWKINSGWHKYTPKAVGYGSLNHPYISDRVEGTLVELDDGINGGINKDKYLFIADNPVIDPESLTEDMYFFHEGIFDDKRAYGRCWFVNKTDETGDILTTNNRGMFIRVEHTKGLHV